MTQRPQLPTELDVGFPKATRELLGFLTGVRGNRIAKLSEIARPTFKIAAFTKNLADATGSNTYSLGFRPRAMVGLFGQAATVLKSFSIGMTDFASMGFAETRHYDSSTIVLSTLFGVIRDATSADSQAVLSVPVATADGFTLSWTKAGTPTSTGTFAILALADWAADMVETRKKVNEILELLHGPYA